MRQNFTNCLYALLLIFAASPVFSQTVDFTYTSSNNSNCTPDAIIFTQQCTGSPLVYLWDFGNTQRGFNDIEKVVYDSAGTYNVTLTAVFATGAITVSKTVVINPTPAITLTADKSYLCAPGDVRFTVNGNSFSTNYEWNFGDDTPVSYSETGNFNYTYRGYGTYNASVKAITSAGCNAVSNYSINISKFGITASLIPDNGCVPAQARLGVSLNLPPGDMASNYNWTFGDGSPSINSSDSSVDHLYNTTDSITAANVSITSVGGCTNQLIFPPFAYGTPPVNTTVRTEIAKDTFCGSETIKFFVRSGKANSYVWEFGDSTKVTSGDTVISHKYRLLGKMKITVTPYFNGCKGQKDSIFVQIKGVIANYTYNNLCSAKNIYQFNYGALGNVSRYHWTFSDNGTLRDSVNHNPVHTFPLYGTFRSSLYLYDNITGCSDETQYNIYTAVPSLNRSVDMVCKDDSVTYTVTNSYPDSAGYTYEFYAAGDSVLNGKDSVLNYHPSKYGSYADYVVIKDGIDGTCNDTLRLNNITVKGPVVSFTTEDRRCTGTPFTFTNASYPYYNADAITKWEWNYGDSIKSELNDPAPHAYQQPNLYNITLRATDINGCTQTAQKSVISDYIPQVIVFPAVDTICSGKDSALLTAYTIDELQWMPTTNILCNTCDSTKVFPTQNTFYVAQATSRHGCKAYDTSFIKVYAPFRLKIFPSDTSVCQGQSVSYTLNVNNGITSWSPAAYLNNSSIVNPVAKPAVDTAFIAIVTDSAGCYTDTAVANIHLFQLPVVNAGEDKVLPYNTAFTITPVYSNDVTSYSWARVGNLSCYDCPSPSGTALQNTTYTIQVLSDNGCRTSDNINIAVQCEQGNLLMPTAFSPNGNGINEYFYPIARGYKIIKKFVIFNRNGNKVFENQNFEPNNPAAGWDGIGKGAETVSSSETFVWYIEAECQQGEIIISKGTVVLVK